MSCVDFDEDIKDAIQEVTNVAVGLAADKVARCFSTFVKLPIPKVHLVQAGDIAMAMAAIGTDTRVTAVAQPFFGDRVSGEALLLFSDASLAQLADLMGYDGNDESANNQLELVLEMASILNGACIHGVFSQLEIDLLVKHPVVLSRSRALDEVFSDRRFPWKETLALELNYGFEGYDIECDLIILMHERCLPALFDTIKLLLD